MLHKVLDISYSISSSKLRVSSNFNNATYGVPSERCCMCYFCLRRKNLNLDSCRKYCPALQNLKAIPRSILYIFINKFV